MSQSSHKTKRLLIVEDDPGLHRQFKWCFSDYETIIVEDRESAIKMLHEHMPPVVTLDLGLPPDPSNASEGLATLESILSIAPDTKVIVVTGNDDKSNALKAIGCGAYDFYQKPIEPDVLTLIVDRAYKLSELEKENKKLLKQIGRDHMQGFIGSSAEVTKIFNIIEKVAPTEVTTLLLGESGTGKELIARALHNLSTRNENDFVAINCAAIPENLLESELFGYEKGAFTDARKQTLGKIEYANHGTLFLDEVGDLPQSLQAKLLRFLQQRVIERVGGREEIPVDVRIICATHQNLNEKMKSGEFREDLYYRISEISIKIPRLKDRVGDAVLLAKHFVHIYSEQHGKSCYLTESAITAIEQYEWPGNVRELENKIKRAVIMVDTGRIEVSDLELFPEEDTLSLNLKMARESAEREAVLKALSHSKGKITLAAGLLGVSRPTLYDLLDKYNLRQ